MTSAMTTAAGAKAPVGRQRKRPGVLPGFGLSMGFTVVYLSLLVLLPLVVLPLKSASLGWEGFWRVVTTPQALYSYQLTFGAAFIAALCEAAVLITPTYTGCPATIAIELSVRAALDKAGFGEVPIETVLSPPWSTDWITAQGRARLHAYGIAPPTARSSDPVACPRCGSLDTEEVSRFGSTPCKALWRCRACHEPFDRFKCH